MAEPPQMVSDIRLRLGPTLSQVVPSVVSTLTIPQASSILAILAVPSALPNTPSLSLLSLGKAKKSQQRTLQILETSCALSSILGKLTRRGSSDAATEMESLSARHSHSHHTLVSDLPDPSNSHGENTVKEGGCWPGWRCSSDFFSCSLCLHRAPC